MSKYETKNDKFEKSTTSAKGVRPPHSSDETSVTEAERRGRQSSCPVQESHPANSGGPGRRKHREGKPDYGCWIRLSLRAQGEPNSVFNNLLLHVNVETLKEAFDELDGKKASGVDGTTKSAYGKELEANLANLAERIKRGSYKPQPKREVLIPKANGKTRPIAIACFEDKLVDAVISKILTSIYDDGFVRNSYGFRPRKSAHQAVEMCYKLLEKGERPFVVEIDFSDFFNTIPHRELMEILGKKIADKKLLRLVERLLTGKTLKQDGAMEKCTRGTPQGGLASPILANIYLDEVLDKWYLKNYKHGSMVRYADDAVFFFGKEEEAKVFLEDFRQRVEGYKLIVNEEKSRSLSFRKTEHTQFDFLGFTFYWSIRRNGRTILKVKTEKKKLHRAMREFYDWIKTDRSKKKLKELWELAKSKIRGHYEYFGYWTNRPKLVHFYQEAVKALFKWLNRRSQKRSYQWEGFDERIAKNPLGRPPKQRFLREIGWSFGHVR